MGDNKNSTTKYPVADFIKTNPLTVIFFAVVSVMFVLYFVMPDKEISEWENRYLQMRPELSFSSLADKSFMDKYESYTNDQMPLRDMFIDLKALCETAMFKVENNGIAKGKNSYLFTKDIKGTEIFDKNINAIGGFVSNVPNDVTVAVAPNACAVLKDYVPAGFPVPDQAEKLLKLYNDKSLLKGANVVDLYSAVNAHGDEYIYYMTDHHWTSLGAYYAYLEITGNGGSISPDDFIKLQKDGFYGTLYAKYKGAFVKPDTIDYYEIPVKEYITDDVKRDSLYDVSKLDEFDKYGMFMCGNFGLSTIKSGTCANGKKLIVFKDSYANCLIPFLTFDYEDIDAVDLRFFKGSVQEYIGQNGNADILFLYNFDFLNEDNHFYKLMK